MKVVVWSCDDSLREIRNDHHLEYVAMRVPEVEDIFPSLTDLLGCHLDLAKIMPCIFVEVPVFFGYSLK